MFDTLIESKPKKERSALQMAFSLILHGVLIFGAVKATQGAVDAMQDDVLDTTLIFLEAPKETPPEPEPPPPDQIVSANPPPKGFQTVVAPEQIPTEIPPVNLNERPVDPRDFTGKGVEGGIAAGVVGGTGPVEITGEEYLQVEVDDPPRMISSGPQRFPPAMQAAGIQGRVVLEFVVDTSGHAEPNSFKVLSSSHKAFEEPAKEMILKSVFKPGRVRGQAVRTRVQQIINFSI